MKGRLKTERPCQYCMFVYDIHNTIYSISINHLMLTNLAYLLLIIAVLIWLIRED